MKMDFQRVLFALTGLLILSACGQNQAVTTGFQKTSEACTSNALATQFIVRNKDGSTQVVQAASENDFINGYMKDNEAQIQYAEHDYRVTRAGLPVEAMSSDNTSPVADNWGVIKVEADRIWSQNIRGSGVVVAVIDTGVDIAHPQLASQIYTNTGEQGLDVNSKDKSSNGVDDDANGLIDDTFGYDFVNKQPLKGDHQFHGTHVAGIIAAAHQDTVAKSTDHVQGIAPGAKILPLAFLDNEGSGLLSDAVSAIQYAVLRGARVINASWGGTQCSQTLRDEIGALASHNVFFVAAAGNESSNVDVTMEYPASLNLPAQITVGATGDHDLMAQYSNYGLRSVHIFAPGTRIVSTLPQGAMGFLSGTSMATPFVTGAVALLLSAVPDATVAQIRSALYTSAYHDAQFLVASQGRMDLAQTLSELQRIVGHN